ncbi:MAG: shikimate kinase [Actinomycetes bacterium]
MTQSAQSPHIVLIGLMGTGKSTVGQRLAKRINFGFFDTDKQIEIASGRSVREIFADDGEETFRDMEATALREALSQIKPLVVAAAGGCVLRDGNRHLISQASHRIWLTADLELITQRVSARALRKQGHRPLLDADPRARLSELESERRSLYAAVATTALDVTHLKINEVVDTLATIVLMEVTP